MIRTWTYQLNTSPTDQSTLTNQAQSFMYQFTTFLTSNGWSIESSSGWGSRTALTWAASGTHSWICLKSPAGIVAGADGTYTGDQSRIWITLDLLSASVYQFVFTRHRVAPTGGTSTARPTSTDQLTTSSSTTQFLRSTLSATCYWHFWITEKGEFIALVAYNTAGYCPFVMCLLPLGSPAHNVTSGKDHPYVSFGTAVWLDSGLGAFSGSNSNDFPFQTGSVKCWLPDGTVGVAGILGLGSFSNSANNLGYNFLATGDFYTGTQPSSDARLYCTTTNKGHYIGQLVDLQVVSQVVTAQQGMVDSYTTPTKQLVGIAWVPVNTQLIM